MNIDGRYELLEQVGAGGTAQVWKGKHLLGNFICAVKLMEMTRSCFELCKEEFRLLSMIYHPHIIRTFDMGYVNDEGPAYLSMEFISGKTWKDIPAAAPDVAVEWMGQLITVLQYLHDDQIRIVHKDIKPSNIVVEGKRAVLIDFNIAGQHAPHLGTPAYKCPIVEQDGQGWKPYADVWALAVSFYELVTGHELFRDDRLPSFSVVLRKHPKVNIPTKMFAAVCRIIGGAGQDVAAADYKALFGIEVQTHPIVIPVEVLRKFDITSRNQGFLIKAMLAQEDPRKSRSKAVVVNDALKRVGLPTSRKQQKTLRAVFSVLKKSGAISYTGRTHSKVRLTEEILSAINEATEQNGQAKNTK